MRDTMLIVVTISFVAVIMLASVALTIVQFRRITPLVFRCTRCGNVFHQPPHHDFPRACPRCHALDWAA